MVKNPPSNAGDAGLIPGRGTKISHATGQLSPHALQLLSSCDTTAEPTCPGAPAPQLEREISHAATTITTKDPTCLNKDPAVPQIGPDAAKKKKKNFFLKKKKTALQKTQPVKRRLEIHFHMQEKSWGNMRKWVDMKIMVFMSTIN